MSEHPDHAALIAEARSDIDYMRQCWRGATIEPEYSWLANYIAVVDALASAPSPRTPLPRDKWTHHFASGTVRRNGEHVGYFVQADSANAEALMAAANASKVEPRTPTREEVVSALTGGGDYYDNLLRLFTSPEAPESDDGCGSPHSKGGKCAYDD